MTTYRALKGYSIKSITSDPANPKEGQIWYNSSSKAITIRPLISAWASGGNMGTDRKELNGQSGGIQTAGIVFGGNAPGGRTANSEEYNGSAWAEGNNYSAALSGIGGFGTQDAQVGVGGEQTNGTIVTTVNEYNGTSWSGGEAFPIGIKLMGTAGTLTAGLVFGGVTPGGDGVTTTVEYDGTDWTAGGALNNGDAAQAGGGTQTDALSASSTTEAYNGTAWTEVNDMSTARNGAACGNLTDSFLVAGGNPSPATRTERFDGTSWSSLAAMATARGDLGGCGTGSAGLIFGGEPGSGDTNATEEFTEALTTRTVDLS